MPKAIGVNPANCKGEGVIADKLDNLKSRHGGRLALASDKPGLKKKDVLKQKYGSKSGILLPFNSQEFLDFPYKNN